jgi:hypothetical protein
MVKLPEGYAINPSHIVAILPIEDQGSRILFDVNDTLRDTDKLVALSLYTKLKCDEILKLIKPSRVQND